MEPLLVYKMTSNIPCGQQYIGGNHSWFEFPPTRKRPQYITVFFPSQQTLQLMGAKVPICTGFTTILSSSLPLMVFDAQVLNTMEIHSSSTCLNNINLVAPSFAYPSFRCRTCTTCLIHPFGQGPGFFPPTYKTLPFAIFQKSCVDSGNISAYINTQSDPHHSPLPYPFSLRQGVYGHHLLYWRLHTSLSPQIHVILNPIAPSTKCQNGILPHHITHFSFVWFNVHSLLSLPESLFAPTSSLLFSSDVFASSFIESPNLLVLEIPSNLPSPFPLS